MTKREQEIAREYRAPETSTPEELECRGFKTIAFGNKTICLGYYYTHGKPGHYAAVYEFSSKSHTCEDECKLTAISENTFEDEGHTVAWGLQK